MLHKFKFIEKPTQQDDDIEFFARQTRRLAAILASILVLETIFRPMISDLPQIFTYGGMINSALLIGIWFTLYKGYLKKYSHWYLMGLISLMALIMISISGATNSHYAVMAPIFPIAGMFLGSISLAISLWFLWVIIWIGLFFFGAELPDLTQNIWKEDPSASRTLWLIISSSVALGFSIQFENRNRRLQHNLLEMAEIDALTGITNRRGMQNKLNQEFAAANRTGQWLTVMFIDVDHFKRFNDEQGHEAGDIVLQQVASVLVSATRNGQDLVTRYGGEEFVLILRDTTEKQAEIVAKKIHQSIKALQLHYVEGNSQCLTVTIGYISIQGAQHELSEADLIKQADDALYYGKQNGRNKTVNARHLD